MWRHFQPIWLLDFGPKIGPEGDKKKCALVKNSTLRPKLKKGHDKNPVVALVCGVLGQKLQEWGGGPAEGGGGGEGF